MVKECVTRVKSKNKKRCVGENLTMEWGMKEKGREGRDSRKGCFFFRYWEQKE